LQIAHLIPRESIAAMNGFRAGVERTKHRVHNLFIQIGLSLNKFLLNPRLTVLQLCSKPRRSDHSGRVVCGGESRGEAAT
jgi:hypothetical protein